MKEKFIEKMHPKNRLQLLGIYTVLFIITLVLAFFPFFLFKVSFLRVDNDGFRQHYEILLQLKRVIKQFLSEGSFSFWSWNTGLGIDTIGSFGYIFFNPFSYIAVLFPVEYLSVGYTMEVFFELYIVGIGFLYFAKITDMSFKHSLWGALAYTFSSWAIDSAIMHAFFLTAMVLFVFIMSGVEKVLRRQSPVVLIIAMFFSAITSIYFSYMTAIVVFLYLLFNFIMKEEKGMKNCINYWGRFVLYMGVAACMAAVILMPNIYILQNAVKDTADKYSVFFAFSGYVNYFSLLLGGQEMFYNYSTIGATVLFLLLMPAIIHRFLKKKATPTMITFILCIVFLFFPFFNSMFNGFSYPMGRWCYAATFFFIWSGIQCLADEKFELQKYKKSISIMITIFAVMLVFVGRIILNMNNEINVIIAFVNLGCICMLYHLFSRKTKDYLQTIFITLALICNIILVNFVQFFPGISSILNSFSRPGEVYSKFEYATQRAGTEIADDNFYRIDQIDYLSVGRILEGQYTNTSYRPTHLPANETLVFNTRSIYTYLSTTTGILFDFYKDIGNNASYTNRVYTYGNDNRTRLDFLMGVKYFLGNNPRNNPPTGAEDYSSYGFSLEKKSSQGVEILKNKYSMGMGCVFDSYITESEWLELDYPDREQALMECVVLPDNMETNLVHIDSKKISSDFVNAAYHISGSSNIFYDGLPLQETTNDLQKSGNISIEGGASGSITMHLDKEYKGRELYLIARNLKRDVQSTNTIRYSKENTEWLSRMRMFLKTDKDFGDEGGVSMDVSMGNIKKRALNTIGSNYGFSDISDLMINLGEYNENARDITITLNSVGDYSYDSMEILAVPLSTYESKAKSCISNAYDISELSDNYVKGTVDIANDASMLYLSVPYNDGWSAYVDGKEVSTQQIDTAFLGIPIDGAGKHTVEIKYRSVGFKVGIVLFFVGGISFIVVCLWYKGRKKCKNNPVAL